MYGNQNGSSVFGLINRVRNSKDPNSEMQSILMENPSFQGMMDYISQHGGDARSAFYNMAAQKGVDPESILRQLR